MPDEVVGLFVGLGLGVLLGVLISGPFLGERGDLLNCIYDGYEPSDCEKILDFKWEHKRGVQETLPRCVQCLDGA